MNTILVGAICVPPVALFCYGYCHRNRKRISCFGCSLPGPLAASSWICSDCGFENHFDRSGRIQEYHNFEQQSIYSCEQVPKKNASFIQDLFCATCLTNQTMVMNILSEYIPQECTTRSADIDLDKEYRQSVEERYPFPCDKCEPRIKYSLDLLRKRFEPAVSMLRQRSPKKQILQPKEIHKKKNRTIIPDLLHLYAMTQSICYVTVKTYGEAVVRRIPLFNKPILLVMDREFESLICCIVLFISSAYIEWATSKKLTKILKNPPPILWHCVLFLITISAGTC